MHHKKMESCEGAHPSLANTSGQSGSVASATTNVCLRPARTFVSWAAGDGTCIHQCTCKTCLVQEAGLLFVERGTIVVTVSAFFLSVPP